MFITYVSADHFLTLYTGHFLICYDKIMKITKFAHCSLLVEHRGVRLLTDPGSYSPAQNDLMGLDAILITHEHTDHLHIPNLQLLRDKNPTTPIICNTAVAPLLANAKILSTLLADGETLTIKGVTVRGQEEPHAEIHRQWPRVPNTGFLIDSYLFYPGDAYIVPTEPVTVLALPTGGPWVKIGEALDYALNVKPQQAFPVHDGGLKSTGTVNRIATEILGSTGITFQPLENGASIEL